MGIFDHILSKFPPPSVNNSRAYILKLLHKFQKRPSEWLAQEIEAITGEPADFKDEDLIFDEREHSDYSHIESDPDNKDPY